MRYSPEALTAFVEAVACGSFSAAARRLRKSQSTVSTAISNLEADLGVTLFDRSARQPVLTPQGEQVLSYVKAILAASDRLDELAAEMSVEMEFRPGDMQFIHNHQILHSRTDFEDWPEPEKRRHLLRLWLAPREARVLPPAYAQRYGDITVGSRGGIVVQDTVLRFTLEPA